MRAVLLAILLSLVPPTLVAQVVRGAVADRETGAPLEGATVMLVDGRDSVRAVALTDAVGRFRLSVTAGDTTRLRAERLGYRSMESQPLTLAEASELTLDVQLTPAPIELAPLSITAQRQSRNRRGFERRRRNEIWGRFIDEERLAMMKSPRAVDRLRPLIPGLIVTGDGSVRVMTRGPSVIGAMSCQPRLIIDGHNYPGDMSLDGLVSGRTIRAAEYYANPQQAPAQFSMGFDPMLVTGMNLDGDIASAPGLSRPCVIIVIWTDMGFGPRS